MKLTVVYNYPVFGGEHDDYAMRFVLSYGLFPPGIDHETVIIVNGGSLNRRMKNQIEGIGILPNIRYIEHVSNSGKDIGGFQAAARHVEGDIFVFFGGSSFFWKSGWLKRVAESVDKFGETLYGTMAGGMVLQKGVYQHIRTTCFWTTPSIMNKYPIKVVNNDQRYEFEHSKQSITLWAVRLKLRPKIVTWSGIYDIKDWEKIPDGFHRSDQSGLLFKDRLTEEPYHTEKRTHETNSHILPLPVFSRETAQVS